MIVYAPKNSRLRYCALFLAMFVSLAGGCAEEQMQITEKDELPDQQLTETRLIITEGGQTTAIVEAKYVSIYEDRNYTVIEDSMTIYFYNTEGEPVSTLTSVSGQVWGLYEKVDSLKAAGGVVIISEDRNAKMETPSIRWIAAIHKIFADSTVKLSTEDAVEEGIGFEATDDLKSYSMRNVSGEITGDGLGIPER